MPPSVAELHQHPKSNLFHVNELLCQIFAGSRDQKFFVFFPSCSDSIGRPCDGHEDVDDSENAKWPT